MRKFIFVAFVLAGTAVGWFATLNGDWPLSLVMMTIGAVVGVAIGGGLTGTGKFPESPLPDGLDESHGQGTSPEDLDRNYWRDKGYSPFMKPPNAEPDRHMFDPDRLD